MAYSVCLVVNDSSVSGQSKILDAKGSALTWPACLVLVGCSLIWPTCYVLSMCLIQSLLLKQISWELIGLEQSFFLDIYGK
jgi:hypothetical protein